MNRAVISLVDLANAPEDVRKAAETHLVKGYRLTNEKRKPGTERKAAFDDM